MARSLRVSLLLAVLPVLFLSCSGPTQADAQKTLAYWNGLIKCGQMMRTRPGSPTDEVIAEWGKFMGAVNQLPVIGVDPELLQLTRRMFKTMQKGGDCLKFLEAAKKGGNQEYVLKYFHELENYLKEIREIPILFGSKVACRKIL